MYRSVILALVVALTVAVSGDGKQLVQGCNEFGFDLIDKLFTDTLTNIWISQFCINSCFALIYPGSNGNTQKEIATVMKYPITMQAADVTDEYFKLQDDIEDDYDGKKGKPVIGIANKIYAAPSLRPKKTYIDAVNGGRDESIFEYNFNFRSENATTLINTWVSENTNGLIDSIVGEDDDISGWTLVALNAIYLNGSFQNQFDIWYTSANKFYSDQSRTNAVSDMHLMHQIEYFPYYSDSNYQYLRFNFVDDDLFILFVLPKRNDINQNNGLITDHTTIKNAISRLRLKRIALALPKISATAKYELNKNLIDLGMKDAFSTNADFSPMAETPQMIGTVIHKTMIEMDEKGLVAAAVTAIGMTTTSVGPTPPPPILFKADHPFQMFIIDEETEDNLILFMGQINNPGISDDNDKPTYNEAKNKVWTDFDSSSFRITLSMFMPVAIISGFTTIYVF